MSISKTKTLTAAFKFCMFGVVLYFIVRNISGNIDKIKDADFRSYDPKFMFLAVITLFISLLYPVFIWKFILSSLGENIFTLPALRIWFISNLGRYIPGKVLQMAGLIYFAAKEGVARSKAVQSVLYSQIVSNGLGIIMGFSLLFIRSSRATFPNVYHSAIILIVMFMIILWFPSFFLRSSNFVLLKMKKQQIVKGLSNKDYVIFIFLHIINWIIMSTAFLLMAKSYTNISLSENPEVIFILPISWTLGLLAFFAPGGIGVREGSMTYLLSGIIPVQYALILPWLHRVIVTCSEIILTVIFSLYYKKPDGLYKIEEQN